MSSFRGPKRLWTPGGSRREAEPQQEVRKLDDSGPRIRLLRCLDCKSIDELPAYDGPAERDVLLDNLLRSQHIYASGRTHEVTLLTVAAKLWNDSNIQPKIVQQLSAGGSKGLDELDADYYATKNTYQEDALACFNRHSRPKEGCIDYQSHDKRIGNPTSEGWKTGPRVYACNFCPVQSWVDKKKAEATL